jgi:cbb3-type cytochrome oxidase subunit 3
MNWTLGSMMFYGGIASAILIIVLSAIVAVVLRTGRKKIVKKLNEEYGSKLR